jgi:hypothetical protein
MDRIERVALMQALVAMNGPSSPSDEIVIRAMPDCPLDLDCKAEAYISNRHQMSSRKGRNRNKYWLGS